MSMVFKSFMVYNFNKAYFEYNFALDFVKKWQKS